MLFRQLSEQGSLFATQTFGATTANYLLLAVPAITLLGFALVLLRLFPIALNLASRVLSKVLPVGPTLGLWQMARNPAYYARLSLLLILTAGLGIFAASFGGTLDRSFEERVLYSTGSEIRIDGISTDASGFTKPLQSSYEEIEGIEAASSVYRGSAYDYTDLTSDKIQILAINPGTFDDVGWFRDDFFNIDRQELLDSLKTKAKEQGLWNFFLPDAETGEGLKNLDYAYIATELGKNPIASQSLNCSAPDTGNMEVLSRYGTPEQQKEWLTPLLG